MIARQSTLVVANSVLGALSGFLALFVIVRYMTTDIVGARGYTLAIVSVVGIVARLGLPVTHVRTLAKGDGPDAIGAANGTFLVLKTLLTGAFVAVALAGGYLWFGALRQGTSDTTPDALWIALFVVVVQSLRDIPVASFQGLRRIWEREAVLFTNTAVTVLGTVLIGVAYAHAEGRWLPVPGVGELAADLLGVAGPIPADTAVTWLLLAFLVGEVVSFALAVGLFLWRRIPLRRPRPGMMRTYLLFTVPVMLLAVGEVLTKWLALVQVGFLRSAEDAGLYYSAAKYTEVLLLLAPSIAIVLLPALSNLHARRDDAGARQLTRDVERWTSLLLWPVVAVIIVLREPVIHILMKDSYIGAAVPLALLAVQAVLTSLVIPVQMLAIGLGQPRLAARVVTWSVAVGALLGLVLIPDRLGPFAMAGLGPTGAALASLASTALAIVLYAIPRGAWKGHRLPGAIWIHVAAAAAAGLLVAALPTPERILGLAAVSLAGLGLYIVALIAMRELRRDDWHALRALLRRTRSAAGEGGTAEQQLAEETT